mgnify:CR=1 FL=1
MKKYLKFLPLLALGFVSCEPELDNPIDEAGFYTNGEADFTNYVALGNSLTAGYADGALYITGQENSYPNRCGYNQMRLAIYREIHKKDQP